MKKLIGFILLSFCLSANAQFGDLFKGLEKLAKDLEGGTQQQQAQPSNPQQQSQPQQQNSSNVSNVNSQRDALWEEIKKRETNLVKEADEKGAQVAKASKTKFKLLSSKDQMSGKETLVARYEASIGGGKATTDIFCRDDSLTTKTTFNNINLPTTSERGRLIANGRMRLNGNVLPATYLNDGNFRNVFVKDIAEVFGGRVGGQSRFGFTTKGTWEEVRGQTAQYFEDCKNSDNSWIHNCSTFKPRIAQSLIVYDFAMEFNTASGALFIEMSPYDPAIKRVAETCKK
jgi:hypothetical protein